MTECENAALRDVLPDYVAEGLDATMTATVAEHLSRCTACAAEVALLRVARAVRPQAVHVDVDRIVSRLIVPARNVSPLTVNRSLSQESSSSSASASAAETSTASVIDISSARSRRSNRGLWQFAAAVGVVAMGSLSFLTARSGQVGLPIAVRSDTAQLGEAAERTLGAKESVAQIRTPSAAERAVSSTSNAGTPASVDAQIGSVDAQRANANNARAAVVSVGDLSDYTDAELQKLLDRLDRWDGASSSEVMPSMPLVRVGGRGAGE
jgi:hypothetical protein